MRILTKLNSWNESFEVISCVLYVPECGCRVYTWVADNNLGEQIVFHYTNVEKEGEVR